MLSKRIWTLGIILGIGILLYVSLIYASEKYKNGALRYRKNVNYHQWKLRYVLGYVLGLLATLLLLFFVLILFMRGLL